MEDQQEEHIETQVCREDLDKKTNKHNSEFRWHFQSETNGQCIYSQITLEINQDGAAALKRPLDSAMASQTVQLELLLFTMQTPCFPTARHGFIRSAIAQGRNPPSPFLWKTENLSDRKSRNLSFRRHSTPWKLLHFYKDFMGIYSVDTHTFKYLNFQDNSKHRAFNKNTINFKILA